jgi:hypothetical protein
MRFVTGTILAIAVLVVAVGVNAQPAVDAKAAQQALKDKGHDPGATDGVLGAKSQKALSEFQKASGIAQTGKLDAATIDKLGLGKPPEAKIRNLVTSLGGFSATVGTPVAFSGSSVEIAPGGQTGRQMFRVPTYVYVVEGILTTDYEAGPVGIKGAQYHGAGQSFMDNGGWWHNHMNRTDKPVRYIVVHAGSPGVQPVQKAEAE